MCQKMQSTLKSTQPVFRYCAFKWAIRTSVKMWCHNFTVTAPRTAIAAKTMAELMQKHSGCGACSGLWELTNQSRLGLSRGRAWKRQSAKNQTNTNFCHEALPASLQSSSLCIKFHRQWTRHVRWGVRHGLTVRCLILPFRKRYVKMRESLVRFRSLVHMYVNRKRYIKVHKVVFQQATYCISFLVYI